MSCDSRLRELERRFKESGSHADEAAYFRARVQAGMNGSGLDDAALSVTMHRLVKAGYSVADAEKLFDSPGLPEAILELIRQHEEPRPECDYADEEVESDFGYPEGFRFRTPWKQLAVWRQHFPDLNATQVRELAYGEVPEDAESWGVIPKPSLIADSYHEALERMLSIIAEQRAFHNYREGQLGPEHLRLTQQTLDELERDQPGDFLVFPFQFGFRHRGRSVRRSRALFSSNEWGLGPYETAALLVTHPDRLTGYDQLHCIHCAGCEYDLEAQGGSGCSLRFRWHNDTLRLRFTSTSFQSQHGGSASAFRP